MIYRFVRYDTGLVRNLTKGTKSGENVIKVLIRLGKKVKYTCKNTGIDLLPQLFAKIEDELLGPETPLYKAKQRTCNNCGVRTINRFKCSDCWDSVHRYMGAE